MRKIAILLGLVAFVISLSSCGGSGSKAENLSQAELDALKVDKYWLNLVDAFEVAIKDGIIDDNEADDINTIIKTLNEFEQEFDESYSNNEEFQEQRSSNKESFVDRYEKNLAKINFCEGVNKIDPIPVFYKNKSQIELDAIKADREWENFIAIVELTTKDGIINDEEAQSINALIKKINELEKELEDKYLQNKEELKKYRRKNKQEFKERLNEAFAILMEIEGSDKIIYR